jgi:membrane-associated protease RseP (regulator of RpoE activity)
LGPGLIIGLPGINPLIPIFYGWIALICALVVHEAAHGIIARNLGFRIKSSGLLFLLFIPFGAFVDVDEKQIVKAKSKDSLRVMAAGVGGNIIVAMICILGVFVIINGLTPAIDGVYIYEVLEGLPAEKAGLLAEDVFVTIDNVKIENYETLEDLLDSRLPGDVIQITVARGEAWKDNFSTYVNLTESEGQAYMGVTLGQYATQERLSFYQELTPLKFFLYMIPPTLAPGLVPFSDFLTPFYTHGLGMQWSVLANIFFWLWFINVNLAIFNALPIYPLDGGRIFNISLKAIFNKKFNEKTISRITLTVTLSLICILLLVTIIPFIF